MTFSNEGRVYVVITKLLKGYLNKGHSVYLDNYYTSIPLEKYLHKWGTQITETLQKNRTG